MNPTTIPQDLLDRALTLPTESRAELGRMLLDSLEPKSPRTRIDRGETDYRVVTGRRATADEVADIGGEG